MVKRAIEELLAYNSEVTLLQKANQLKQTDGEGWEIGDLIEKIVLDSQ